MPAFYPAGARTSELLRHYADRLDACELNSTYYRQPSPAAVDRWLASTPDTFRFAVKAQRGGTWRSLHGDPAGSLPWLTDPLRRFGPRLGAVLLRVPDTMARDDARLDAVLGAWPADVPVAVELRHPSWHVDEVFAILRAHEAALCATELPEDPDPPTLRLTGPFLYLRLRRTAYDRDDLLRWAGRVAPFLDAGHDVFAFLRHDEDGRTAGAAVELRDLVERGQAGPDRPGT